jgi:hypothetical protein
MYDGTLILESLKVGTELEGIPFTVGKLNRYYVGNASADQPEVWSVVEFEVQRGEELADLLSQVLDSPGWYADLHDDRETFVVFPGRVFRYPRGDDAAREEAKAYGRTLAIPEPQLDWTR